MEKVGVMAVVEGLSAFMGDIKQMNGAMDSLKPQGNALTNLFTGVGNAISSFGREVLNVAEVALGALLSSAIQYVIGQLKDLITSTIAAGSEFQTLGLRLERLNFNTAIQQTGDYTAATLMAEEATRDQLSWLQKLAVQTPYDAQDIASVFTLARSYGFAGDAAKGLTSDIANFASGMGLGNTEIQRIIVNFGQMVQQGKVTQRELNDLARGAFVPVNDVLKIMQAETGLAGSAFDSFRNSGAGVESFMRAFTTLVETRFQGAAQDMARTFQGATDNAKDFVKSLIGFNVVRPILDVVGGGIADMLGELTAGGNWDRLNASAAMVGESISGVVKAVSELFKIGSQPLTLFDGLEGGLGVDEATGGISDKLVAGLVGVSTWINNNKDRIVGFFKGIKDAIVNDVIPFVGKLVDKLFVMRDWFVMNQPAIEAFFKNIGAFIQTKVVPFVMKLVDAFMMIADWVDNNGPLIEEFFTSLGTIVGTVFENLTGMELGGGVEGFLGMVEGFMNFVVENQESISNFITNLLVLSAVFTAIGFVLGIVMGIFTAIVTPILAVIAVVGGLVAIIGALFTPIGLLIVLIVALVAMLLVNWQYVAVAFENLGLIISTWAANTWETISTWAAETWATFSTWVVNTDVLIQGWVAKILGIWTSWTQTMGGILAAFILNVLAKLTEMVQLGEAKVQEFIKAFTGKEWGQIGRNIIIGIARGISKATDSLVAAAVAAAKAAVDAVKDALGVSSPSKVFMEIGEFTMKGFARGILRSAKLAEGAMESAIALVSAPALGLPAITQQYAMATAPTVNNQNSYTNNYNLNINSSSPVEPIVQDYNMLQSLAGA